MSQADLQYNQIIFDILQNGVSDVEENVRTMWKDGENAYTKSIISRQFRFDNSEIPILTTKKVAWKTAIKELLWIWQMKSNVVQDLRDMGVKIWDEWELKDGTIGKSYGYQMSKHNRKIPFDSKLTDMYFSGKINGFKTIVNDTPDDYGNRITHVLIDQVDYLLYSLKYNQSSRRHITTLWNPDELDEMSLTPCVYETQWHVKDGKLSLEVRSRSNDMALGNPFNVFQYNVLQRMIAQVTGYELGEYIFNIGDAHVYSRHEDGLKEQIFREKYDAPTLWINPEVKSFYDFTIDDFKLLNYKHGERIDFEVAI